MVMLHDVLTEHAHSAPRYMRKCHLNGQYPTRAINHPDGTPYMTRYYLIGGPTQHDAFDELGEPKPGTTWKKTEYSLYLHHFHASDLPRLHNHPWRFACSLMLAGGYHEDRLDDDGAVVRTTVLPGDRTSLGRQDFHRVDLIEGDAWTLFAVGAYAGGWGYWHDA